MLVAIEGIDASGKETVSKLLADYVTEEQGWDVNRFAFPNYNTKSGQLIRDVLTECESLPGDRVERGYWLQSMYTCNRIECLSELQYWADREYGLGILDRYWMSGYVYGQVFHGVPESWLAAQSLSVPQPAAWFLLDITVEESVRRRGDRADAYEEDLAGLRDVRQMYIQAFRRFQEANVAMRYTGGAPGSQFYIINGMQSVEDVAYDVYRLTQELM